MSKAASTARKTHSNVPDAHDSIQRHLQIAIGLTLALAVGVVGWAEVTMISSAVAAPGQLVVESDVKKVQHPTGGVVAELRVREGAHVKAGDILVRLDDTQTRANLDIILKALDELSARRARDEAERDSARSVVFDHDLLARKDQDPSVAYLVESEAHYFAARVSGREGQKAQLHEQVTQLREQTQGLLEQTAAKAREIDLIKSELKGVRELFEQKLIAFSRVNALERDAARLEGERGQLIASTASAKGKITETELKILQIDEDMRTEVSKDLGDIRGRWSEYREKRVAAEDQLKRVDLRAPQDGTVHQMTVHTIGGLVMPNEPAMLIVPEADQLFVETHIQQQDIDGVSVNQQAVLRFPAFDQRMTPEIYGVVDRVSADVTQDAKTGLSFYTARIRIEEDQKERLGGVHLLPGMPVEASVRLGDRSVMSYLTKPIMDQAARAWRGR